MLDYCNSVLYGGPTLSIQKLQRVHNSLVCIVLQQPRMSHARPSSQVTSLVAGSSENRVQTRSSDVQDTLYFSSGVPALAAVKRISESAATLQSASQPLLHVPPTRTVYGVAAPTLWNRLPADITNTTLLTVFRNRLKTFLFHQTLSGCPAD